MKVRHTLCPIFGLIVASLLVPPTNAAAQGFPNIARTPGELISGPIAPEQGRTAIVAWHGERIVSVPEPPGSQVGADLLMRVVDINDPANPQVTILPDNAGGFLSHGYFQNGAYLFVSGHCLTAANTPCTGSGDLWRDSLRIGGPGTPIGTSQLRRASMEDDGDIPLGAYNKSGAQAPWGVQDYWTYNVIPDEAFLAVRRNFTDYIYDWGNGGIPNGPAVTATWDHLAETGVIGFPFIMGNILIFASDMTGTGVAAYDISDLSNPVLLDVLKDENPGGYWPEVYGHYIFFPRRDNEGGTGSQAGYMVVDFEDPTDLKVVADRNVEGSNQYVTFQDEYAFMNNYKIDMRTFDVVLELATNDVTLDASQFALPIGNLVVTGGYGSLGPGLAIWAHQAAPDMRGPWVAYHVPTPDQTHFSVDCPITLSIPETLKTETIVNGVSLIVQPVGGSPIPIWHSFGQGKLLTVTPQAPLNPNTTYEVILTSAIQDAAGNGMDPYSFRFSTGSSVSGGNRPPVVAEIDADPSPATPGSEIDFTWGGSDPDGDDVDYRIDFGDGSPQTSYSTSILASHTYAEEGHYRVTVQARDENGSVAARSRNVTVIAPPAAPGSTASSQMALNTTTDRLFVVNPDDNTVTALNALTNAVLWEAGVADHPVGIAQGNDGALWVVCRDSDAIDIIEAGNGELSQRIALDYGSRPVAIAPLPNGSAMLVSFEGDGMLRRYSVATRAETGSLAVGSSPRAIAVTANGNRALVTRFISGEHTGSVYDVALAGPMSLTRTISLVRDKSLDGSASSRGVPNYLAGIRIAPSGEHAWVVGKKDNTNRGTFSGATMVPGQDNTVRAQLMLIDLGTNAEDLTLRLDIDNSESPTAIAFSELGDFAFITLQGNNQIALVDVLDLLRDESPGTITSRWATDLAPQSVEIDPTTGKVFAANFMDRSVSVLEAASFFDAGSVNFPTSVVSLVSQPRLHPDVESGKQIFYNAGDRRMSAEGYISCATCHVDGSHDGRTFDFTNRGEGFRNTVDLRGRSGVGHGAVHWTANFDEIHDFENDIRANFGGSGFLTNAQFAATSDPLGAPKAGLDADLDNLVAYVSSLSGPAIPRSPYRNADGTMTASALSGQAIFNAQGCAVCHNPSTDYTDRTRHNVGTLKASSGNRLGQPLDSIDTPTLLGLHNTAPYLHDGSAATLQEVFTIAGGRMEQAEDGILGNGAVAEDPTWVLMKDWHGGDFVELDGARTITFNDVASTVAGAGFIEVRYCSGYGGSTINVTVNGNLSTGAVPISPNDPMYVPNEWRRIRVPVNFNAGNNTVVFQEGPTGAQLRVDEMLFVTPGDLAAANAHVRGLNAGQTTDLVNYLLSLDGSNGALAGADVERDANPVTLGGVDSIELSAGSANVLLDYIIYDTGSGPLNLGQFYVNSTPPGAVVLESNPDAQVIAGGDTSLQLRVISSAGNPVADVYGWSDASGTGTLQWTVQVNEAVTAAATSWMLY